MNEDAAQNSRPGHLLSFGYGLSIFLGAFLLFLVQPMVSKTMLPWFGGSPGVWTTCMLVYQWLLFAGYAYAYFATTRIGIRTQMLTHLAILVLAVAMLPILPDPSWKAIAAMQPQLSVVGILLSSIGVSFFLLSSSGPLLQVWFMETFPRSSPYRLYAVSNTGSLLALMSYPFFVEPALSTVQQSTAWAGGFIAYASLLGLIAVWSFSARRDQSTDEPTRPNTMEPQQPPTIAEMAVWFLLGTIPCIMMLAVTNQVCMDVAPVPFLWLAPLAIYLVSFILCFESTRWYSRRWYAIAFCLASALMTWALGRGAYLPMTLQCLAFFSGLFIGAMICHGELSRRKPDPQYLGPFYMILAAAGATGGTFVALLAPVLFNSYVELQLVIAAIYGILLWLFYPQRSGAPKVGLAGWRNFGTLAVFAGGTALGLLEFIGEEGAVVRRVRNFYGVMRVVDQGPWRTLAHGRIVHGSQFLDNAKRNIPTTYYGERSGIGLALRFHRLDRPRSVGVVGMGAGTLAVYGREGDTLRFFELDPDVSQVAQQDFRFLQDCRASWDVTLGDARLSLESDLNSGIQHDFDVLAIDAFSGDAIPVHLLTREAIAIYLRHLDPQGILAIHVSNRHFDFKPILAAHAKSEDLVARIAISKSDSQIASETEWVLLSRSDNSFDQFGLSQLPPLTQRRLVSWTDSFTSLAAVMRSGNFNVLPKFNQDGGSLQRGFVALESGDLDEAEMAFREAVKLNDRNPGTWLHLGNILHKKQNAVEAIRCYRKALELDERYSEAHNNLGTMLLKSDPIRAEQHVRLAIESDPLNAEARNMLANILARQGKLTGAIEQYRHALMIKPELLVAQQNLAVVLEVLDKQQTP